MNRTDSLFSRRSLLRGGLTLGAATLVAPAVLADDLFRTPPETEGPFYPIKLPLDQDNDLLIIKGSTVQAVGTVTHLTGRVLTAAGSPVRDATVEIWQVDGNGVYLHPGSANGGKRDKNFQGFGRFSTNAKGEYYFRTVRPTEYPGRSAPHIHFKVKKGDRTLLTSQFFDADYPGTARDGIVRGINPIDRELLMVQFKPAKDSKAGELAAYFEIVLGRTPDDGEPPHSH
jgi:protocatechuate 3,4-dioxygenase beta subunit